MAGTEAPSRAEGSSGTLPGAPGFPAPHVQPRPAGPADVFQASRREPFPASGPVPERASAFSQKLARRLLAVSSGPAAAGLPRPVPRHKEQECQPI